MTKILISGGTGLIGKHLVTKLKNKGYDVAILGRSKKPNNYVWNPEKKEIEKEALKNTDYIIHLAGTNIGGKRWTNKQKQKIIDSRVKTAQLLFDTVKENNIPLKAFISASAVGYYGAITSDHIFIETDSPANDFLGETCRLWEQSADQFEKLGIRTVKIRTGVVLSPEGGALERMITPVKMGIGSAFGSGKQYMPWIHINDLCNIYIKAVEDAQMIGAYNAAAPEQLRNKEFMRTLASVLKAPFWFPAIPAILLQLLFGKMSAIILEGSRVSATKITAAGFQFQFLELESALENIFKK
jgi:uncharacterized protein (TIGR01777 family)